MTCETEGPRVKPQSVGEVRSCRQRGHAINGDYIHMPQTKVPPQHVVQCCAATLLNMDKTE